VEKKTALYDEHVAAGGRMVPFAGYLMPIQYTGIIEEHRAVREAAGLFDLSHMGEFRMTGSDAVTAIDRLVTNDIAGLEIGQIRYTPMCYPNGGIVDDLLVYRADDHLMLVVNAANIEKDLNWVCDHVTGDVRVENISDDTALIAIQGPLAQQLLAEQTDLDLAAIGYYRFTTGTVAGVHALVSRTGYTGEDGFELYLDPADAAGVWRSLRTAGRERGLRPIGLGARDTLRLEAGLMLYGNDIDETTNPLEAGLGWTVKFTDEPFVGRDVLERQKADGLSRRMVAFDMQDRAIPRQHYPVLVGQEQVGEVTSGTFSPTFGHGIGLAYVRSDVAKAGTDVSVEVRGDAHPARVVRKPIYRREGA
jgi:aminomethyltransferase